MICGSALPAVLSTLKAASSVALLRPVTDFSCLGFLVAKRTGVGGGGGVGAWSKAFLAYTGEAGTHETICRRE